MKPARLLALAIAAAALTACSTPSTPDAVDTAAQEAAISAPSGAPTIGPSTQTAKIGDTITLAGLDGLKLAFTVTKVIPSAQPVTEGSSAGDGREFYGAEITVKNAGTTAYDGNPGSSAVVIDSSGQQFDPILADIKGGVSLGRVTIAPGDHRKGVIVFAVAKGASIAKLQLPVENGDADQTGEWTIQ